MSQSTLPLPGTDQFDDDRFAAPDLDAPAAGPGALLAPAELVADRPTRRLPRGAALLGTCWTLGFVGTSSLMALLPAFATESQFPAVLPALLWVAAPGIAALSGFAGRMLQPWRSAFGYASLAPWAALLFFDAAAPHVELPWWLAGVTAAAAALPLLPSLLLGGVRLDRPIRLEPATRSGSVLAGLMLMFATYSLANDDLFAAILGVVIAALVGLSAFASHGLADAAARWRRRDWAALLFGTLVAWGVALADVLTPVFADPAAVLAAVLAAGGPLVLLNLHRPRRRPRVTPAA